MERSRMRIVLVALVVVAAVVFGAGIDWGLPSRAADGFLFSATSDPLDPTTSYRLSGAGIDHLAGRWDDDPNRAADVAAHPIDDRSKPVTLLENRAGQTADKLAAEGDQKISVLLAAKQREVERLNAAGEKGDSAAIATAQEAVLRATADVERYLARYNQEHYPDFVADGKRDAVQRARIMQRYRLYSYQPDEMITFRALALMHPQKVQLDPRLYQYGGLWIYPVGAMLKAGSLVGLTTLTADRGLYLDHPEEFGRLYIVARAYSAMWGAVGVLAIFLLMRKLSGGILLPAIAAIGFIFMPVVIDLAHEAKPHLAGAVILLLAVLAGSHYIESGKRKWLAIMAALCGAAAGMVLWAAVGLVLIPIAVWLARGDRAVKKIGRAAAGVLLAAVVYFATNPYVGIRLVQGDPGGVLRSNLSNSNAMYRVGPLGAGVVNAIRLIAVGMSWPVAILGVCGVVILIAKRAVARQQAEIFWMLGIAALLVLVQFVIFAAGKPGEYARFALLVDIALLLAAVAGIGRLSSRPIARAVAGAVLVIGAAIYALPYERGFLRDATTDNTRFQVARKLAQVRESFPPDARPVLGVRSEPAPYSLPPVNLTQWKLVLLPRRFDAQSALDKQTPDVAVQPNDSFSVFDPGATPMSWAGKTFEIAFEFGPLPIPPRGLPGGGDKR